MEEFSIYDVHQQPTGRSGVRGRPLCPGEYRVVVTVLIFNSNKELLIQQRAGTKEHWPSLWDFTAGGQVLKNEVIHKGAERELFEELGIEVNLSNHPVRLVCSFEEGWDYYYFLEKEIEINDLILQKEEVSRVKWVSETEYLNLLESGTFIPYIWADKIFDLYRSKSEYLNS